jgi:hypothetical protein
MSKLNKLIFYIVLFIVAISVLILSYLEYSGRTNIIADYASDTAWSLTDGDALSPADINNYIHSRNPNIKEDVGHKLSHYCKKYNVNPAFVLGIAEADSSNGLAGVGRSYKNPGNTKISHSSLDQAGIGHAPYKGENNFTIFNKWADGYSAIALTLNNYSYYNLRGQITPILSTYAGHPNPNYYVTVTGVMSQLLSKINIQVALESEFGNYPIKNTKVTLRRSGNKIKSVRANKNGLAKFNNLPREQYALRVTSKDFRSRKIQIPSPQKTTEVAIDLIPRDRVYLSGQIKRLLMTPANSEGIIIRLNGKDGELVNRSKTTKNGFYYFGNLLPGEYVVSVESRLDLPTGFFYSKEADLSKKPKTNIDFLY